MDYRSALKKAVKIANGQAALAAKITPPVRQQHVWNWLNTTDSIPAQYCPSIEGATGVRCEELCPDVPWHFLRREQAPARSRRSRRAKKAVA